MIADTADSPPRPIPEAPPSLTASGVVSAGIMIGVAAGFVEVGLILVSKTRTPILEVSRDIVWMAPLAGGLAGGALCGLAALATVFLSAKVRPAMLGFGLFGALAFAAFNTALYLPRLHDIAVLILALGMATVVMRAMRRWGPTIGRSALQRGLLASLLAVLAAVAVSRGDRALGAKRALAALPVPASSDPNVVLISIDTGRPFNMSLYGYERRTTPWLDSLARESAVFESAIATAPWTLPSHASMFTGRWAKELSTDYVTPLDASFPTVAEFLRDRGYVTLGAVANLRYTGHETGLDRGFVRYIDYPVSLAQLASSLRIGRKVLNHPRLRSLIQNDQHLVRIRAEDINRRALSLAPDDSSRPVFLFLNYFDVHEPYLPPSPFDLRFGAGRARGQISPLHRWLYDPSVGHAPLTPAEIQEEIDAYDGSMAYLDTNLRSLFDSLRTRWARPTLFIITADHGEEFGEHGVFDHGNSLYYASVRVPLIIGGIEGVPPGRRITAPVSLREIPRTIATIIGAAESSPFPGSSLTRWWSDEAVEPSPVFAEVQHATGHPDWFPISRGDMVSVQSGVHRYILNGDGREELYDLALDVWEMSDVASDQAYREVLLELRSLVQGR